MGIKDETDQVHQDLGERHDEAEAGEIRQVWLESARSPADRRRQNGGGPGEIPEPR